MNKEELNENIKNNPDELNSLSGFEIICEALVYKIYDMFGRNGLLSLLYQIGKGPGETIAKRIKEKYNKDKFEILEAMNILLTELKEYYSVQIRDIEENDEMMRLVIENRCFLRNPIKHRPKLQFGKSLCRVNKGYFECALNDLLGDNVKKIEINFLGNDDEKDKCIEELKFYYNNSNP
ncbi:MAG: hypothetical protein EU539_08925 [Promethearchaeota archaeon]|nr:MAG: hypothetical protein EU539_08925 [Candidatus Lokiarchaeota archaeon]